MEKGKQTNFSFVVKTRSVWIPFFITCATFNLSSRVARWKSPSGNIVPIFLSLIPHLLSSVKYKAATVCMVCTCALHFGTKIIKLMFFICLIIIVGCSWRKSARFARKGRRATAVKTGLERERQADWKNQHRCPWIPRKE